MDEIVILRRKKRAFFGDENEEWENVSFTTDLKAVQEWRKGGNRDEHRDTQFLKRTTT